MVWGTLVFLCLHAPHAVEIFRDLCKVGEGGGLDSAPMLGGRGAIGRDMFPTYEQTKMPKVGTVSGELAYSELSDVK
jgi:hypothetical protein